MLIPKISHLGYSNSVLVTPNVNTFSFKDIGLYSEGTIIIDYLWTATNLVGAPDIVLGYNQSEEFTLSIEDIAHRTRVTMTITDSNNNVVQTSCLVINDGLGNISIIMIGIEPVILPSGLIAYELTENEELVLGATIYGTSPFFTTYQLDYTNNGVYDVSQGDLDTIYNTFTGTSTIISKLSITDIVNVIPINQLFTQVAFEPVKENLIELSVTGNEDCTLLTVYSETVNYVEKLIARGDVDNSEMEFLGLTIDQNCCNNQLEFQLAPRYQFTLTEVPASAVATPTSITLSGFDYDVYHSDILIGGIDMDIVESITYTKGYNSNTTTFTSSTLTLENVEYLIEDPIGGGSPVIVENKTITITTNAGFVYIINYTITPAFTIPTSIDIEITSVTYPDFPDGISIVENSDNTSITISPEIYDLDTFYDGVYTITMSDSDISNSFVTGCTFVDCETYCLIIKALANNCNPFIKILYDALKNFNNCFNIPCKNICELYAYLESLLDECDCTIYHNNVKSKNKRCGCGN